ncbi:heparinase II/III family protein [Mobilicoccus sp.]|uniref:heparinase II/III domain-containing protein n=1 Tax=Mobilicoccus sp. TaxID=2034349 RepID=UPI0028AAE4E8|nr:heparinase II/III family protein [Mobilicoccus sp.]
MPTFPRRPLGPVSASVVTAAAALVLPLAAPAVSSVAADRTTPQRSVAQRQWADARCGAPASEPVRNGKPMTVRVPPTRPFTVGRIPASAWSRPASSDPTWQLSFYGLDWMKPLAKRAFDDRQDAQLAALVAQADKFYVQHPDRGSNALGWDEGTSLRRLHVLTCLSIVTGDPRLTSRMATEVRLLFGPRYYGPPNHPVHNHGLMANVNIRAAGEIVGREDWVRAAEARMRREAGMAFTKAGTSYEQSAWYHLVNTMMWRSAGERMAKGASADPAVRAILAQTERSMAVGRWLTEPDGDLVQIGDTPRNPGWKPVGRERPGVFRDNEAGIAVGRWSWTDPKTTYYTVRYGPARFAHGHPDKGGVTWSARGTRVLVGPGYYGYDWRNSYAAYARQAHSHNVAWPTRGRANPRATAAVRSASTKGRTHTWRVLDREHGVAHTRDVRVDHPSATLTVSDTYPRRTALRQSWHLDPGWRLVTRRPRNLVFRDHAGRTLRLVTDGAVVDISRGRTRPVAGWNYPSAGSRIPAYEITTGGTGTVRTTFTVR